MSVIEMACPYCVDSLVVEAAEWTGGPTGWTAYVCCRGCDMQGPGSSYVYPTRSEAEENAVSLFAKEPAAINELRAKFHPPRAPMDAPAEGDPR